MKLFQNGPRELQNRSLEAPKSPPEAPKSLPEAPKSLPEAPKWVPGGSLEAPEGLPDGSRDSGRPPERSKGLPEDHFRQFWSHFGVIWGSFFGPKID